MHTHSVDRLCVLNMRGRGTDRLDLKRLRLYFWNNEGLQLLWNEGWAPSEGMGTHTHIGGYQVATKTTAFFVVWQGWIALAIWTCFCRWSWDVRLGLSSSLWWSYHPVQPDIIPHDHRLVSKTQGGKRRKVSEPGSQWTGYSREAGKRILPSTPGTDLWEVAGNWLRIQLPNSPRCHASLGLLTWIIPAAVCSLWDLILQRPATPASKACSWGRGWKVEICSVSLLMPPGLSGSFPSLKIFMFLWNQHCFQMKFLLLLLQSLQTPFLQGRWGRS